MKKLIALVAALIILLSLAGCKAPDHVLKAWTGEFSEEEQWIHAINEYQNNYDNIVLPKTKGETTDVTFETDFEAIGCSVVMLSHVDDTDINVELKGYIDLALLTECDGNQVTVPIDWWYGDNWVNDHPVWSYLVCVRDAEGAAHYYYFRTEYSA